MTNISEKIENYVSEITGKIYPKIYKQNNEKLIDDLALKICNPIFNFSNPIFNFTSQQIRMT